MIITGETRDETVRLTAEHYGVSLEDAANIVAIELGESQGDRILVDDDEDDGEEAPPASD